MPLALSENRPVAVKAQATGTTTHPPPPSETELDRILKLIPTEVIAFYTAVAPLGTYGKWLPFVFFLIGLTAVPLILFADGKHSGVPAQWPQYLMRLLSFIAWAVSISWPFSAWVSADDFSWLRTTAVLLVPLVGAILLRNPATPAGAHS